MNIRAALLLALLAGQAQADSTPCWGDAAARYGVPVQLLKAVAQVESSNRARVVARNTNGSLDIGYMQVNDWWLPHLSRYGIGKQTLLDDPCINLNVGAWILRQGIDRYGYNWQGIGAYGAGTSPKRDNTRMEYAGKVFRALAQQRGRTGDDGAGTGTGAARLQPAKGGDSRQRGGQQQQQQQANTTAYASRQNSGERLVWSVFDND